MPGMGDNSCIPPATTASRVRHPRHATQGAELQFSLTSPPDYFPFSCHLALPCCFQSELTVLHSCTAQGDTGCHNIPELCSTAFADTPNKKIWQIIKQSRTESFLPRIGVVFFGVSASRDLRNTEYATHTILNMQILATAKIYYRHTLPTEYVCKCIRSRASPANGACMHKNTNPTFC